MAVRDIVKLPDKRLRLLSEPVKQIDVGIRKLVDDMLDDVQGTGIGLAAISGRRCERVILHGPVKKRGQSQSLRCSLIPKSPGNRTNARV